MLSFDIQDFKFWVNQDPAASYELKLLNKMQARRLPKIDKIAVDLALQVTADSPKLDAIFYASRHGELQYSYELLEDIAQQKSLSPTKFSQSVHNAVASFITVEKKTHIPVSAIAAGADSALMGLLAGLNFLNSKPGSTILVLFSDAIVPSVYHSQLQEPDSDVVLALTLKSGHTYSINMRENQPPIDYSKSLQSIELIKWLNSRNEKHLLLGQQSSWQLNRK